MYNYMYKSQACALFYQLVTSLVYAEKCNLMIVLIKSWGSESDRMKEKLLVLIGRIGKEARVGKITTKVYCKINQCDIYIGMYMCV